MPLVMRVPPHLLETSRNLQKIHRAPVTAMDLFPTILDLAGIPLPASVTLDGLSLRSVLDGTMEGDVHDCVYYWRERTLMAVRCGLVL